MKTQYDFVEPKDGHLVRDKGYLTFWLTLCAFSLGLFALWSGSSRFLSVFFVLAYGAVFLGVARTIGGARDILNPLCLILLVVLVRYSCQAFLLSVGVEPTEAAARFYNLMGLSDSDWLWAHVLALTSLVGITWGWLAIRGGFSKPAWLHFSFPAGLTHAAVLAMAVGVVALVVFIGKNASLEAIETGAVRATEVQEGTGIYQRLGFLLISGSVLLSAYLMRRRKKILALVPPILATIALAALGGRGVALTPLMAASLLHWYHNREQNGWPRISFGLAHVFIAVPSLLLATWFFYFVGLYRGGHGLNALRESLSLQGIWEYIHHSIFVEFGSLHSLAGAIAIGPGVLEGRTFLGSLTFPLSKILPIPGRSAGIFIIETLVGADEERRWGLHASLIGDAYLNFGVSGILVVMPVFGMLLKFLYVKFRTGTLNAALYAFAAVYSVNLFQKSIDAWPNMMVGLIFMIVIIRGAPLLNVRRPAFA